MMKQHVCVCLSLTDRGDVCDHKVSSLWYDGLQTYALQTGGQLPPLVLQSCRQLLQVALWSPQQLVLSLKSLSHCLLEQEGTCLVYSVE